MTTPDEAKWPQIGLEEYFDHVSSFIHLNINLGSADACKIYHDKWMQRYAKLIKSWSAYDTSIWAVRSRQALKSCFSATYFALLAEDNKKNQFMVTTHFLNYYSSLHAMLAVLFLMPDLSVSNLERIGHDKISTLFCDSFAAGPGSILQSTARQLSLDLRFLREYYSYRMPLNSPLDGAKRVENASIHLGGFVKQTIQLANLHSHLVHKAAERHHKRSAKVPSPDIQKFKDDFFTLNGKVHSSRDLRLLEPSDSYAMQEYLKIGCDIMPLSVEYDHMYDEYMTWASYDGRAEEIIEGVSIRSHEERSRSRRRSPSQPFLRHLRPIDRIVGIVPASPERWIVGSRPLL